MSGISNDKCCGCCKWWNGNIHLGTNCDGRNYNALSSVVNKPLISCGDRSIASNRHMRSLLCRKVPDGSIATAWPPVDRIQMKITPTKMRQPHTRPSNTVNRTQKTAPPNHFPCGTPPNPGMRLSENAFYVLPFVKTRMRPVETSSKRQASCDHT